ncbi:cell division protein ZapA [Comamonas sp. NoAH]|uniref:cell division protein ZapA n=1 Tax=Comamonas halotolerans TaxID=3041496 RepID=UPI0024E09BA7|nr:cell division protein ZapA [Comamonas sp. NoAH]
MSQIETQILHQEYLLTCPDGQEEQLLEAVERVDQQFQQMRDTSKLRSRERVCVLLAVNLAFENLELRNQLQSLQQKLATHQGTHGAEHVDTGVDASLDVDMERLQTLEAQAAHDQAIANEIVERMNQVLAEPVEEPAQASEGLPVPELPQQLDVFEDASAKQAATFTAAQDLLSNIDLDNARQEDLTSTSSENL